MKKLALIFSVVVGAIIYASVAHAQINLPFIDHLHFEDAVVQQDFDLFQQQNIGQRFNNVFKPHASVCNNSTDEAHCNARVITDSKGSPLASVTTPTGYGPTQFLKAYNLTGTAPSSAPTIIAIVDAYDDPNIVNDLATYNKTFGIPQLPACSGTIASSSVACFKKVNQTGKTSYPSPNAGWALEISLDVELAHAVCQQNCSILLVEANSASYANLMTAVNEAVVLGANVVSNSYGGSEFSGETSYDSYFNHPGVAFIASAGDSGYGVEYPAASRYVTAVGGTSLYLNSDGSYNQEMAWSGTGSGCSAFETKPTWQNDLNCTRRTVSDISADANPNTGAAVYDSVPYGGRRGWFQVGGTSLSSPIIAAVYALSGAIHPGITESSLPYLASSAYFHDITTGSNGTCGGSYLCSAVPGYDGPTGLGTPNSAGAI